MPGSWLQLASGLAGLRSPLDAAAAVLAGQPGGARAIAAQPAQRQQAKLRDPEPAEDEDFSRDLAEMEAVAQRVAGRASPARAAPAKRAEREADAAEDVEDVEDLSAGEAAAKNSVPIDNFTISQRTKDVLKKKRGIQGLFPIQAACFEAAFSGKDVIGRASGFRRAMCRT